MCYITGKIFKFKLFENGDNVKGKMNLGNRGNVLKLLENMLWLFAFKSQENYVKFTYRDSQYCSIFMGQRSQAHKIRPPLPAYIKHKII